MQQCMKLCLSFWIVLNCVTSRIVYPVEDDYICKTPNGQNGSCISVELCKTINTIINKSQPLSTKGAELLQNYHCGFDHNTPKMCCPPNTIPLSTEDSFLPDVSKHKNRWMINSVFCGTISADKIYGGRKTSAFEFPWMALLAYKTKLGITFGCGGSLINDKYVLTAAHCITNLKSSSLVGVRLGEHDIRKSVDCDLQDYNNCAAPVQDIPVHEIIPHPEYNSKKMNNDLGLLKLERPANLNAENVKPICLPTGSLNTKDLEGKYGVVAGWGATEIGISSPDLLKVSLRIISNDQCQSRYQQIDSNVKIGVKQFCAGGSSGKDSCTGDSGGPLMYMGLVHNDTRFVQYGIVSFGPKKCGLSKQPGVYTRVASYLNWILDEIEP